MLAAPCVDIQWLLLCILICRQLSFSFYSGAVQQGADSSCILLFTSCLLLFRVSYSLCLLPSLLQWGLDIILRSSAVSQYLSMFLLVLPIYCYISFGLCSPFLFRFFCIVPWNSLSGLCALWGSLSSFPSLLWASALWMACMAHDWLPFVRHPSKHIYCKTDCNWLAL